MKKTIAVFIVLALVATPILLNAQAGDACAQAYRDARRDTNGTLWFAMGCLLGVIGVGIAYFIPASPRAASMVGKPAAYVDVYTDCYKDEAQTLQVKKSFNGCLIWGIVALIGGFSIWRGCLLA